MTTWISYGAGVNSTALLVLAAQGKLGSQGFRLIFSDTGDEKPETYAYLDCVAKPYAKSHGLSIETCHPKETVLGRWKRLKVTGSRMIRSCTDHGKIQPIKNYIKAYGSPEDIQAIGIHAGESHRAKDKPGIIYPLVELGIDHDDCKQIILEAGLPVPLKSGCWHCPFMRKAEIINLIEQQPQKFQEIISLEDEANQHHQRKIPLTHFGNKTAREWRDGGPLFASVENDIPCSCFDGLE
jgi:3'-phosphoadenosine 5'-phosphosulfate sulfotransferase (PAPS reductase)/FAD synthetase